MASSSVVYQRMNVFRFVIFKKKLLDLTIIFVYIDVSNSGPVNDMEITLCMTQVYCLSFQRLEKLFNNLIPTL